MQLDSSNLQSKKFIPRQEKVRKRDQLYVECLPCASCLLCALNMSFYLVLVPELWTSVLTEPSLQGETMGQGGDGSRGAGQWATSVCGSAASVLPIPPHYPKRRRSPRRRPQGSGSIPNRGYRDSPWWRHPQPGVLGKGPLGLRSELALPKATGATEQNAQGRRAGCVQVCLSVSG